MVTVAWYCPVCPNRHRVTSGHGFTLLAVLGPLPVPARIVEEVDAP